MLLLNEKVKWRQILVLFFQNAASNVDVTGSTGVSGLVAGIAATAAVVDISDTIELPDYDKSYSISLLIKI